MLTTLGLRYGTDGSAGMGTYRRVTLAVKFLSEHGGPQQPMLHFTIRTIFINYTWPMYQGCASHRHLFLPLKKTASKVEIKIHTTVAQGQTPST